MFTFRRFGFFTLMAFASSLSACAAGRTNLVDTGTVDVQVQDAPKTRIQGVAVWENQQQTIVYGRVQRLGVYDNAFFGRKVTAEAVFPDGSTDKAADTILTRIPSIWKFRMIYPSAKFKIVFPQRLPDGTTIYLKFAANDAKQVGFLLKDSFS